MTYLQLINRVLRGLREPQVSSITEEYTKLIGQLVNEAKEDLEDAGPWYALRTTIDFTLPSADNFVNLSSDTNDRSYLVYDIDNRPQMFNITSGFENRIGRMDNPELVALRALSPNAGTGQPIAFSITRPGYVRVQFWPTADQNYSMRAVMVVPQDELADGTDVISVPAEPVWREALARAMEERGEEFSSRIDRAAARALQARNDAIMRDFGADPKTFEAE